MNNVAFDKFEDLKSDDNGLLIWIFKKFPGALLEYEIQLYFNARDRKWSAYRKVRLIGEKAKPVDYSPLVDILPEEERARALAAAIKYRREV